jgi:hypothetical protein
MMKKGQLICDGYDIYPIYDTKCLICGDYNVDLNLTFGVCMKTEYGSEWYDDMDYLLFNGICYTCFPKYYGDNVVICGYYNNIRPYKFNVLLLEHVKKFKYNNVKKCIEKLNIDPDSLQVIMGFTF